MHRSSAARTRLASSFQGEVSLRLIGAVPAWLTADVASKRLANAGARSLSGMATCSADFARTLVDPLLWQQESKTGCVRLTTSESLPMFY